MKPNQDNQITPQNKKSKSIESFITVFSYANAVRLFTVLYDLVISTFTNKSFLPKYFGIFGLLYYLRLAVDIGAIAKETFTANAGEPLTFKQIKENFKAAMADKARNSRIINDLIWANLNLACLLVNPLASIWLTIAGFTFDIIHEGVKMVIDMIGAKEEARQKNAAGEPNHTILDHLKDNLYNVGIAFLIALGTSMAFFPPTALPGALILATGLGFGVKDFFSSLWGKIESYFFPTEVPAQAPVPSSPEVLPPAKVTTLNVLEALQDNTPQKQAPKTAEPTAIINNAGEKYLSKKHAKNFCFTDNSGPVSYTFYLPAGYSSQAAAPKIVEESEQQKKVAIRVC